MGMVMIHLQIGMSRLLQAGVNAVSTQWSSSSPPSSSSLLSPSAPSPPVVITCVQNQSHSQSPCLLHRLLKRRLTINSIKIIFHHFSTHSHFSAAPACCWCIHYLDDALQGMSRRWMKNDWQIYILFNSYFDWPRLTMLTQHGSKLSFQENQSWDWKEPSQLVFWRISNWRPMGIAINRKQLPTQLSDFLVLMTNCPFYHQWSILPFHNRKSDQHLCIDIC